MGVSPKWVKSKKRRKERKKKEERLNNGDNNGQATHGARKHAWRTQAAWAKNYFAHGRFPEVGQKQKTEEKEERERERETD